MKSITDEDGCIQISISPGCYEIESLDNEIKMIIFDEGHYAEPNYPFTIKPNFLTLGSIIEIFTQGPVITLVPDDSIRYLLGFNAFTIYEEHNLSPNPVDILSSDNIIVECDIAQGKKFRNKRSGIIHNLPMDVDLGYNYIEKLSGIIQWYLRESKDIISSICFTLNNGKNLLVSFNGQSITFGLSIKEV